MTKSLLSLIFLSTILWSCNQQDAADVNYFFDTEVFADEVIKKMENSEAVIFKSNSINNEMAEAEVAEVDWSKELELLKQANINKAAFQLSYRTDSSALATQYSIESEESLPVKELTIKKDSLGNVTEITAKLSTDNYLYSSEKNLKYSFDQKKLSSYEVNGWQELFIGDRKNFSISGETR
ncbi:hypothetical protein [Jiulongibacter sp. NS-SX5]|uniref:hypothetical protein n=1 Tax=Jiulongibacter sp. NS-SX5 TaxID=3463854 RepID=UPI004059494A